jgi:hypothetical protein
MVSSTMTDPALIEAAAQSLFAAACPHLRWNLRPEVHDRYRNMARAVTPMIEAAALERAAKVAEEEGSDFDTCNEIAAAIRSLKSAAPPPSADSA